MEVPTVYENLNGSELFVKRLVFDADRQFVFVGPVYVFESFLFSIRVRL